MYGLQIVCLTWCLPCVSLTLALAPTLTVAATLNLILNLAWPRP